MYNNCYSTHLPPPSPRMAASSDLWGGKRKTSVLMIFQP